LSAAKRPTHLKQISSTGHPRILAEVRTTPIYIGNDASIGFNAAILRAVTIRNGANVDDVVVVWNGVATYTIVAGNPVQIIGRSRA